MKSSDPLQFCFDLHQFFESDLLLRRPERPILALHTAYAFLALPSLYFRNTPVKFPWIETFLYSSWYYFSSGKYSILNEL